MHDEIEYRQYIRKFATDEILKHYSNESIDIYKNREFGVKYEEIPFFDKRSGVKIGIQKFYITQWELLEICFNSIKYGNDYRNIKIDKDYHYNIINKTKIRSENLESASKLSKDDLLKHMICIANMEFDLETINIKNKFNRIYYIMAIINKDSNYNQTAEVCYIDFSEKFKEITNLDYDIYTKGYFLICTMIIAAENPDILSVIDLVDFNIEIFGLSKEQLLYIISLQAKEYDFYKKYDNWNILKYYPIVKTQKEQRYIISNISALLNCFSEYMYWTIRRHYENLGSRDFTTYFGYCFEFYLKELFDAYNIKAKKLVEDSLEKKPDWRLETQNYVFYIEQKAALFSMDTRSIISKKRLNTLDTYIRLNIVKAFTQLNSHSEITEKPIIRMCLMLEKINFPETVQELALAQVDLKSEEHLNWIISINEFEKLMYILSTDVEKFNVIIDKKIELEKIKSNDGRGFDTLLRDELNDFISNKINYFDNNITEYFKNNKDA